MTFSLVHARESLLNGEPVGAMKRVPGSDDHSSNVSAGGSVQRHSLTKAEEQMLTNYA